MNTTTQGAATQRAAAPESLRSLFKSVWSDLPGLVNDRVELLSLELRRSGQALLRMVLIGVALAVVGLTAWVLLWGLIVGGLTLLGLHWMGALLAALAAHGVLGAWLLHRVKQLLPKLGLPATRRHLAFTPAPATPASGAAAPIGNPSTQRATHGPVTPDPRLS